MIEIRERIYVIKGGVHVIKRGVHLSEPLNKCKIV